MKIRILKKADHDKTRPIYENIFSEDSKRFVDYYYTEKTKDNTIYVAEEDGAYRSMLHLNPYNMFINGKMKETNYIVAVATEEEYRKRGFMGKLLKAALCDMAEEGKFFTFLMPVRESIYTPYDFRTVYEQEVEYYDPAMEFDGEIRPATDADCAALAAAENGFLKDYFQIFAIRDEAYFQRLLKEYATEDGSLMTFFMGDQIVGSAPYFPENHEEGGAKPKIMFRILDVRRMLMTLSVSQLLTACFTVTDPIIEDNNRCLYVTGTEFSGLLLMKGEPEKSEGTITIGALTSLIFGAKTVEEICQEDGVEMSEHLKEELAKIVPLSRIFINEVV
ncbi:MAG: GNAT family N-acetyltransferase [Dorea sp.]|nr:GNAT family N-acetyltransferase [Dorea sp.]